MSGQTGRETGHSDEDKVGGGGARERSTLARIRWLAGWSATAAARECGISRTTLGNLEAGRSTPRLDTAQKLADAFRVDVAVIVAACGKPTQAASHFTVAEHSARTRGMTSHEQHKAFGELPQPLQDEANKHIAEQAEADPERQ